MTLVSVQREGRVLHLTLDEPERHNCIDAAGARALLAAAQQCATSDDVDVLLMDSRGPYFCPGGDLRELGRDVTRLPTRLHEVTSCLHAAIGLLHQLDAPIVVAVGGGATAGAGLGLACVGDLVFAVKSARFVFAYSSVGLTPDAGVSYFLPRLVGLRRALHLALTNRPVSAHEAAGLGLVTQVVPDAELAVAARQCVDLLLEQSPAALRATKGAIHRGSGAGLGTSSPSRR